MGQVSIIPRGHQLRRFVEAVQRQPSADRRTLFQALTGLSEEELDHLLYNGLCPPDDPVETWDESLRAMASLDIVRTVENTIRSLQSRQPSGGDVAVALYPMDEGDRFGRDKLGGVSGFTNWEGTVMSLVVYPAAGTMPRLIATPRDGGP